MSAKKRKLTVFFSAGSAPSEAQKMKQMKRAIEKGLWKLNNCSDGSVQTVKFGGFLMNHLHT